MKHLTQSKSLRESQATEPRIYHILSRCFTNNQTFFEYPWNLLFVAVSYIKIIIQTLIDMTKGCQIIRKLEIMVFLTQKALDLYICMEKCSQISLFRVISLPENERIQSFLSLIDSIHISLRFARCFDVEQSACSKSCSRTKTLKGISSLMRSSELVSPEKQKLRKPERRGTFLSTHTHTTHKESI
jgi:RNase P/RNase MRP subunit p30